jgi:exopolysaccharide biosynthesis protein
MPNRLNMSSVVRALAAALTLLLLAGTAAAQSAGGLLPLEPLCFEGEADYTYHDDHLAVNIKRYEQDELVYHIADVQIRDVSVMRTALSHDKINGRDETVSAMADRAGAVLAINADYFQSAMMGVIIRNGELIRNRSAASRNLLVVDSNGNLTVITDRTKEKAAALAKRLMDEQVWQTFEFGPELVRDGAAVSFSKAFKLISLGKLIREPRTAIGQIGPLHYMIVVVDGRKPGYSMGMSLQEMQAVFVAHGASVAFNLDGGGSSTLYFMGKIIHRPGAGKQREVSDMIYFK